MTITKELFIDEASSDDICPVAVHIMHMANEWWLPTGITCAKTDWDHLGGLVRTTDTDHVLKNRIIDTLYRNVGDIIRNGIDRKITELLCEIMQEYKAGNAGTVVRHNVPTVHSYIIRSKEAFHFDDSLTFYDIIDRRISTIHTLNTLRGYEQFRRYITRKIPNISARSLDQEYVNQFIRKINDDYRYRHASVNILFSKMRAVINFGKRNGLIDSRINIEFPKSRYFARDRNLSIEELSRIYALYMKYIQEERDIRQPRVFSLALFILDIAFQGLAPRDIASLKVGDIKRQTIYIGDFGSHKYLPSRFMSELLNEGKSQIECVIVNTSRQKTGNPVTIVSDLEPIRPILNVLVEGKRADDYLIPCFDSNVSYTDSQLQNRLANYFNRSSKYLNSFLRDCDTPVCQNDTRISFYYARHAFCNCVDCLDIPRNLIQSMVGHRTSVLENSYLRPISLRDQALVSRALFRFLARFSSLP